MSEEALREIRSHMRWREQPRRGGRGGCWRGSVRLDPISCFCEAACDKLDAAVTSHSGVLAVGWKTQGIIEEQTSHDFRRTPTRYSLDETLCPPPPPRACLLRCKGYSFFFLLFFLGFWTLTAISPLYRIYSERYRQHVWRRSFKVFWNVPEVTAFPISKESSKTFLFCKRISSSEFWAFFFRAMSIIHS